MRSIGSRLWLAAATLVAVVATAWSLYFSLGLGLIPCELCWYQRILMYPLTVILGVAALENRPGVVRTALPLSVLGSGVAAYHSWFQATADSATCSVGSCGTVQYQILGLTVPNLSLIAFVLVSLALVVAVRR
ncbi:disulfide bond formation protein B [Halococcus saccharolyticus]|uniref:Disulfide bond formation protein DsbB n=1 Tax=Halococcus saccharolyticus DSM 5350 TaxID=1227455 RepID=M0MS27_9EURY|nr:disulfide bond formation protein B [Halococcus saccharolyticus]EMA47270.1 disulfide bond formation protein DsbB [Halococcus saccharolyticus DSM 5350]